MTEAHKRRRLAEEEKPICSAAVYVFSSRKQMSEAAAAYVRELTTRCRPRILFPAGTTPLGDEGFFAALQRQAAQGMNARAIRLVSGDEYFGVPHSDPGCFAQYLTREVIKPLDLDADQAMMLDGGVSEEAVGRECADYEQSLRLDPLDLAVLGLGTNGHVAFNDPPTAHDSLTRKLVLTEVSIQTARTDFPGRTNDSLPRHALSVGLSTLSECAAQCIVMAPGAHKADIIHAALEGDYIGPLIPASQLRNCSNFAFFLDTASASKLQHVKKITVPEGVIPFAAQTVAKQRRKAVLCADIGGTNGRVRVFLLSLNQSEGLQVDSEPWFERVYRMSEFRSYAQLATRCMADITSACTIQGHSVRNINMRESCVKLVPQLVSACWAVCGPVWNDGEMNDPNNLWPGEFQKASTLAEIFEMRRTSVKFVNDFEAIGHSIAAQCRGGKGADARCQPKSLRTLYTSETQGSLGVVGCMGAGTGLGVVFLTRDNSGDYKVFPSEGGMTDSFSPRNELEWELKKYLMQLHGEYIEIERIVSGPGLVDVYRFLCSGDAAAFQALAVIEPDLQPLHVSTLAQQAFNAGQQSSALAALDLFLTVYGRALGAACVTLMPYEGIYIAGGILSKLLWRLESENPLLTAYLDLGPKMSMISKGVSLTLIMDETVGLSGALKVALELNSVRQ